MEVVKGLYSCELSERHACGFCRHHHCYLTVKQMRCKNCLGKNCWYLVKNTDHNYWRQREAMKQKRKDRKKMINEYAEQFM